MAYTAKSSLSPFLFPMPDNQKIAIVVARGLKVPLSVFSPELKCYTCDAPPFRRARD